MRFPTALRRTLPVLLGAILVTAASAALKPTERFTLEELDRERAMNAHQFANLFELFHYSYYPYVQQVEDFLENQAGDCDDYAVLADHVLAGKGYHTRLVRVALAGSDISHVICYVNENKAYLDYNNRKYAVNLERSGPTLRQIAAKVADSFEKNWTSATEYSFTYAGYHKTTHYTVVKTDSPERDPDRQAALR